MDFDLLLFDRINVIKEYYYKYHLESNSYIAFSGGKDSMVLSKLFDLAIPDNNIPRVYTDTGLDFKLMHEHVLNLAKYDTRIIIVSSNIKIKKMLDTYGYPFKSKYHSGMVFDFNNKRYNPDLPNYVDRTCPDIFRYQFDKVGQYNYSANCCYYLKKLPAKTWAKDNKKSVVITGIRKSEGGIRSFMGGCVKFNNNELARFNPIFVLDDNFINEFINTYNIDLCTLYKEPYKFERTGCKGCPYDIHIKDTLLTMKNLLPNEYKQCMILWGDVYKEYKRINYLLGDFDFE